jgi:predicted transcriptional regulator
MNKNVLISINPQWRELIASGKKTIELRKTKPSVDTTYKCLIYETKGQYIKWTNGWHTKYGYGRGKVVGEFVCNYIDTYECEFSPFDCCYIRQIYKDDNGHEHKLIRLTSKDDDYINWVLPNSCVSYMELKKYMGYGVNRFYGWHISDVKIYDKPKELSEFGLKRPPQSWCYIKENKQ